MTLARQSGHTHEMNIKAGGQAKVCTPVVHGRTLMSIEYRSHYFDDPKALASFERYAKSIFDLDFSLWKEKGQWDSGYTPFSAFVGGECVASICVYPSEMIVQGKRKKGAQLLTVGTLPAFRLKGIQRELWKRVNEWIGDTYDFVFLFTDDSTAEFYKRLGLRRQVEFSEIIRSAVPSGKATGHFTKLDLAEAGDYACLERLAKGRDMVSERIGFYNPNLLLFVFLYFYRDCSYYVEDLDTVVVAGEHDGRVRVYDIVAPKMPGLQDLLPFFSHFEKPDIEFLFCTDRLGIENVVREEITDNLLFVSDNFHLDGHFIFPYSIRA